MQTTTNYKAIKLAYKAISNSDELDKQKQYYTSVDSESGNYKDGSMLASKIINSLERLDMHGELCASVNVTLKHNNHDLGAYYSVEIYYVEVTADDDSELYNIVEDYMHAGREQIENIIRNIT